MNVVCENPECGRIIPDVKSALEKLNARLTICRDDDMHWHAFCSLACLGICEGKQAK